MGVSTRRASAPSLQLGRCKGRAGARGRGASKTWGTCWRAAVRALRARAHGTACAPALPPRTGRARHLSPHDGAPQVGLDVLVLAQVLARQVLERQAVAAACRARAAAGGSSAARSARTAAAQAPAGGSGRPPAAGVMLLCQRPAQASHGPASACPGLTAAARDRERWHRRQQQRHGSGGAEQCSRRLPRRLAQVPGSRHGLHPLAAAALLLGGLRAGSGSGASG